MKAMRVIGMALAVCALAFPVMLRAQENVDLARGADRVMTGGKDSFISITFDEPEPAAAKEEEEDKGSGSWGGFGGAMIQYLPLDLSPLDPMTEDRRIDVFRSDLLLIGGQGGLIYQNFRFGGFGFGNSWDTADDVAGKRRSADMTMGGGGVFLELNNNLSSNAGLAIGTLLGAGSISLKASGNDLGGNGKWSANRSFFMAYPYVGFWLAPTQWMWLQANAGYMYFNMDTGGDEFENKLGVEMVDGDIIGGFAANLTLNFGWNPNE